MSSKVLRVVIPVAAVAAVVPFAIGANAKHTDGSKLVVQAAPDREVSSLLGSKFSILNRERDDADELVVNWSAKADIDEEFVRASGMNLDLAKRLSSRERIFAVPAKGTICLVGNGAASCTPEQVSDRDFQVNTCGSLPPKSVGVRGLVRDGISSAQIRKRNGGHINLTPSRNYLSAAVEVESAGDLPVSIELKDAAGERESYPLSRVDMEQLDCGR